jgi:hypothetical protein
VLVRDPIAQGALALIWAVIPLTISGDLVRWLEAGLLSVPLVQVAVTDLRTRYVYTVIAAGGLVIGLVLGWHFHQDAWWLGVFGALAGALVFLGLYFIGRLIYRGRGVEPMARGDITIAAMVGAGAAACAVQALLYGIFATGALAAALVISVPFRAAWAVLARRRRPVRSGRHLGFRRRLKLTWRLTSRSMHVYMPYGPGLCVGGLLTLFVC